jgi:hypothetical protein
MTNRFAVYLLLAGCVGFGAISLAEFDSGSHSEAPAIDITAARAPKAAAAPQQHGLLIDQLVATALARPLFSATRRPSQQAASNSVSEPALTDTRLAGIVTAPGQRLAVFVVTGAKPLALAEGETVSGWYIESITARQVSLSGLGGTKTLQPEADEASAPQGMPATGPPELTFSRLLPDQQTRDEE